MAGDEICARLMKGVCHGGEREAGTHLRRRVLEHCGDGRTRLYSAQSNILLEQLKLGHLRWGYNGALRNAVGFELLKIIRSHNKTKPTEERILTWHDLATRAESSGLKGAAAGATYRGKPIHEQLAQITLAAREICTPRSMQRLPAAVRDVLGVWRAPRGGPHGHQCAHRTEQQSLPT